MVQLKQQWIILYENYAKLKLYAISRTTTDAKGQTYELWLYIAD